MTELERFEKPAARTPQFVRWHVPFNEYSAVRARGMRGLVVDVETFARVIPGDWLVLGCSTGASALAIEPMLCEVVGKIVTSQHAQVEVCLVSLGVVGFAPLLQMFLPRPVLSLKNRRALAWEDHTKEIAIACGGKTIPALVTKRVPVSKKSKAQQGDVDMVQRHGQVALSRLTGAMRGDRQLGPLPFAPDDMVELHVAHLIADDRMVVRAIRVGQLPDGRKQKRGTQRDIHGTVELIADALQGVWYDDDRQVETARAFRYREDAPEPAPKRRTQAGCIGRRRSDL